MQTVQKSVLIMQSAPTMYELINNVAHYPRFLPWCAHVDIHEQTEEITDATLHISYFGLKTHFRTRNQNQRPHHIVLHFVEGPFKHLEGHWVIQALNENAAKITFSLDYTFSNSVLEKLIGPVFDKITATFVDAFIQEADGKVS